MATKNRWETLGIPTMYLHVLCITTKMWGSIEAFCRATCSNSEVIFPEWWTSSEAQSHKIHQHPSPFMIVDAAFSPLPSLENGKCTQSEFWKPQLGMDHNPSPTFGWSATPCGPWALGFDSYILDRQLFQLQTAVELRLLADAFDRCHGTNGNHTLEAEQCFFGSELVSWLEYDMDGVIWSAPSSFVWHLVNISISSVLPYSQLGHGWEKHSEGRWVFLWPAAPWLIGA